MDNEIDDLKAVARRTVQAIRDALPALRKAKLLSEWARLQTAANDLEKRLVDITATQPIDPNDLPRI
jgi:hypothetical protein